MTISVKVNVPETAKWRARVVTQDRPTVEGEFADSGESTVEPGSTGDFTVTDARRVVVEEVPLADAGTESNAG